VRTIGVGLSAGDAVTEDVLREIDYVEIKTITEEEAKRYRARTRKPLFFHIQYTGDGGHYLPAVMDFEPYTAKLSAAFDAARPAFLSVHFGLCSPRVRFDGKTHVAVAEAPPFAKETILDFIEKNLRTLKRVFPRTPLLIENVEFVPEAFSKGSYRYVQEAGFFSEHVTRWHGMGLLDGAIFDVAHGLITAGNHPSYNGLGGDPVETDEGYVGRLGAATDIFRYFADYVSRMPLHLVREIHISGPTRLANGMWVDSHREVGETELRALKIVLDVLKVKGVEYLPVTLEYAKDLRKVIPQVARLRECLRTHFL